MKKKILVLIVLFLGITAIPLHAQWEQCNGPWQGNVNCFTEVGTSVIAGTGGDGIYVTTDNGNKWKPLNQIGLSNNGINCFLWSGSNLFVGTDGGIFLSTNNGGAWFAVNSGVYNLVIKSMAQIGTNIFAGTSSGVFVTNNNGAAWYNSSYGMTNTDVRSLLVMGNTLLAGTGGGIFKSTDNGNSWASSNFGLISQDVYSLMLNGSVIFAGTSALSNAESIYRSTDEGNSWVSSGLPNIATYSFLLLPSEFYAATSSGIYRSTNNGGTWSAELGMEGIPIKAGYSMGTNILLGTPQGIFLSTNGGTAWDAVGYKSTYVWSMDGMGANLWATVAQHEIYLSTNNGDSWIKRTNGLEPAYRYTKITTTGSKTYAAYINNNLSNTGVFETSNDGANWNWLYGYVNRSIHSLKVSSDSLLLIGLYYKNGDFSFYGLNPLTYYSTFGLPNISVWDFAFKGDLIFAGTNNGVFVSADRTSSWGITGLSENSYRIAISGDNIYAAGNGVSRSTDNGAIWTPAGLTGKYVLSLAAFNNSIVAGTQSEGIFISTDLGMNWHQKNDGLESTPVNVTEIIIKDGFVYSAIDGLSVWKRSLGNITAIDEEQQAPPSEFSLMQNYPNPFNPSTSIQYAIGNMQFVQLKVYDVLGNDVAILVDEFRTAGRYKVDFNASELSSGVYFYRLTAGSFTETKKFILVK